MHKDVKHLYGRSMTEVAVNRLHCNVFLATYFAIFLYNNFNNIYQNFLFGIKTRKTNDLKYNKF